jgi:hypothetical protein
MSAVLPVQVCTNYQEVLPVHRSGIDTISNYREVFVPTIGTTDSIANKWHIIALPRNSKLRFAHDACLAA